MLRKFIWGDNIVGGKRTENSDYIDTGKIVAVVPNTLGRSDANILLEGGFKIWVDLPPEKVVAILEGIDNGK